MIHPPGFTFKTIAAIWGYCCYDRKPFCAHYIAEWTFSRPF